MIFRCKIRWKSDKSLGLIINLRLSVRISLDFRFKVQG